MASFKIVERFSACSYVCFFPSAFFQQDGEVGHSVGGEKVGLRKAPNHPPYLHPRAGQDQTIIKVGYCVKQGALVSLRDFFFFF